MYLVDRGMIGLLVDYYMGQFSPFKKAGLQRAKLGGDGISVNLTVFMARLKVVIYLC